MSISLDLYEVEQDHGGQMLKARIVVEQTLSIIVALSVADQDLDEKMARAIAEQFLDEKLDGRPDAGKQAWWIFQDVHRISYHVVDVTFGLNRRDL